MPGVYLANRYRAGCTLSLPVGLVSGENNRRGYVRRSCSVGLMDGGSIPPGSTIWVIRGHPKRSEDFHKTRIKRGFFYASELLEAPELAVDFRGQLGAILGATGRTRQGVAPKCRSPMPPRETPSPPPKPSGSSTATACISRSRPAAASGPVTASETAPVGAVKLASKTIKRGFQ